MTSRWVWPEPLLLRGTFFSTLLLLLGFSMAPAQPFAIRFCRKSHRDVMDLELPKSWGGRRDKKKAERNSSTPQQGLCFDMLVSNN